MPANFRNRKADWIGTSPVSTGIRTICFYLQDGMPANVLNRKADWNGSFPLSAGMRTLSFYLLDGMRVFFRDGKADYGQPSPVSSGMRTFSFYIQNGMPAHVRNRYVKMLIYVGRQCVLTLRYYVCGRQWILARPVYVNRWATVYTGPTCILRI